MKLWANFRPGGQFRQGLHTLISGVRDCTASLLIGVHQTQSNMQRKSNGVWRGQSRKRTENKNLRSSFLGIQLNALRTTLEKSIKQRWWQLYRENIAKPSRSLSFKAKQNQHYRFYMVYQVLMHHTTHHNCHPVANGLPKILVARCSPSTQTRGSLHRAWRRLRVRVDWRIENCFHRIVSHTYHCLAIVSHRIWKMAKGCRGLHKFALLSCWALSPQQRSPAWICVKSVEALTRGCAG